MIVVILHNEAVVLQSTQYPVCSQGAPRFFRLLFCGAAIFFIRHMA